MKIKEVKATGKYVVIKVDEIVITEVEEVTKAGIIVTKEVKEGQVYNEPGTTGKKGKGKYILYSVGPQVNLDDYGFKIGDEVFINDYDAQTMGDDDSTYILCKADSIKAVVIAE